MGKGKVFIVFSCLLSAIAAMSQPATLPAVVDVTALGAATYTIPIEVVPGTKGVQPSLAAAYNSLSGQGILGARWSLQGISSVSRTGQEKRFDGNITPVSFDTSDRLTLDGRRLLHMSGTDYHADGVQYCFEVEDFTRVERRVSDGHLYFVSTLQDGTVVEYGRTSDSRLTPSGSDVLAWMADKVMDADGNYMTYHYLQSDGEILVDRIDYTRLADGTPSFASVEFQYGAMAHPNDSYVGGRKVRQSKKLARIDVKFRNRLVRSYKFLYESGTHYECLKRVELCGSDGESLSATQFRWGALFEMESSDSQIPVLHSGSRVVAGNFGDDRMYDVVAISGNTHQLFFLKGTPEGIASDAHSLNHQINLDDFSSLRASARALDIDGDGVDELLYWDSPNMRWVAFRVDGANLVQVQSVAMTSSNTVFADFDGDALPEMVSFTGDGYLYSKGFEGIANPNHFVSGSLCQQAGDFDGDGKMDLLLSLGVSHYVIFTYDLRARQWRQMESYASAGIGSYCIAGDFNGDGMADLLTCTPGSSSWYVVVRRGPRAWSCSQVAGLDASASSLNQLQPRFIPLVCDIDGDGKSDILQETAGGSVRYFMTDGVYEGSYRTLETGVIPSASGQVFKPGYYTAGDFDGNGVPDFLFCNQAGGMVPGSVKYLCSNRYPGYFMERVTDGAQKKTFFDYKSLSLLPGRLSSDGMNWVTYPLVSSVWVSDGIGGYDTTWYFYGGVQRESRTGRFAGFSHFGMVRDGIASQSYSSWLWRDGQSRFDMLVTDSVVTCAVSPQEPTPRLYSPGSALYSPATISRISKTANTNKSLFRVNTVGNVTYLPYSYVTIGYDYLRNIQHVTRTTLGDVYNMWQTTKIERGFRYVSIPSSIMDSRETDYTYTTVSLPNGNTVVKPSRAVTRHFINTTDIGPRRDTLEYTYTGGRLSSMRHSDNCGLDMTESYVYSTAGTVLTRSIAPRGDTARTSAFAYDSTSRFVTVATDHAGNTTQRTHDPATGLCLSETDINGLVTTYEHDALGRPTLTTFPDGTTSVMEYTDNNSGGFQNAQAYTTVTESGKPQTTRYYDRLGRHIHTYTAGHGYTHTVYDHRGRVTRQANLPGYSPLPSGPGKGWTFFWYDDFGRVIKDSSLNSLNRYSYGIESNGPRHYESVENAQGAVSTRYYDAAGRLSEVHDGGGTITYTYDRYIQGLRCLDRTTVATGGHITTIFSDSRAGRTKLVDPDAGTLTSSYNAWGSPLAQTDGKGDVTTITYDSQGRPSTKSYTLGDTTETYGFTYGTAAPVKGKLLRVTKNGAVCVEYVYDSFGRPVSVTRNIDGNSYVHSYSYNSDGLLNTVEYPDSFTIRREYDTYGRLKSIKDDATGQEIYTVGSRNTHGRPNVCWFGNETGAYYGYTEEGIPEIVRYGHRLYEAVFTDREIPSDGDNNQPGRIVSSDPGDDPMPFEDDGYYYVGDQYSVLNYTFNNYGYIVAKEDSKTQQHEDYEYDGLGRLTLFTVNGIRDYHFEYDGGGNMTLNSRVGDSPYAYDSDKPHAVTGVTDGNGVVSHAQCDVTWGSRNRATSISEGGWQLEIGYGMGLQREKSVLRHSGTTVRTTHYISGDSEREITALGSRYIDYIYADGRVVALHVHNTSAENDNIYYVQTDLLGNWNRIVDADRNVVQSSHFDPWGNRMKTDDWTSAMDGRDLPFHRGFTGHEHYDRFGIINMNARLYDPAIARFFSPDPQIQDPYSTQGFNRYSYCGNNPVMYIDEDGEIAWFIPVIGAVVGGTINLIYKAVNGQIHSVTDGLVAFGIGAAAGATAAWVGAEALAAAGFGAGAGAGAGGFWGGMVSGATSSFVSTTMVSAGNNTYFGDPMPTTGQFMASIAIGGTMGGFMNGAVAKFNGKTFWTGESATGQQPYPTSLQATKTPQELGREGEEAANIPAPKERIESLTGTAKYRVPDGIDHELHILYEVKNVSYQGYTCQIKDYIMYCESYGYKFILVVRQTSTTISTPLQEALKTIPSEVKKVIPIP